MLLVLSNCETTIGLLKGKHGQLLVMTRITDYSCCKVVNHIIMVLAGEVVLDMSYHRLAVAGLQSQSSRDDSQAPFGALLAMKRYKICVKCHIHRKPDISTGCYL